MFYSFYDLCNILDNGLSVTKRLDHYTVYDFWNYVLSIDRFKEHGVLYAIDEIMVGGYI